MEIKKEWLIDRAKTMLHGIDAQIGRLQRELDKCRSYAEAEENERAAKEKELLEDMTAEGWNQNDINMELADYNAAVDERLYDDYYSVIDNIEKQLTALKQDREIYKYYLEHNGKEEG